MLEWIFNRTSGKADAKETAIGYIPNPKDLHTAGLNVSNECMERLLSVEKDAWLEETRSIHAHFESYGEKMPKELFDELAGLEERLNNL